MDNTGQSSLEYLMTYGWALILIATILGVLVFVISSPSSGATFTSSDPTKILLKAGTATSTDAEIKLQNITGGRIEVTNSTKSSAFSGAICTLNSLALPTGSSSIQVTGGGEIDISCSGVSGSSGTITLEYTDYAGFQRQVAISMGGMTTDTSLIAYYTFNEGSGTTASDSAGSNGGTLLPVASEPTWQTTGCAGGNCLLFDGADDYIDIPSKPNITGAHTFSAWFKQESDMHNRTLIFQGNEEIVFGYFWSGKVWHHVAGEEVISTTDFTGDRDWHHVTGVWDTSNIILYIDGVEEGTTPQTTAQAGVGTYYEIGRYYKNEVFHGRIDEIKIYNRALSASEVCTVCKEHVPSGANCNC
jgi:hypothetical protein